VVPGLLQRGVAPEPRLARFQSLDRRSVACRVAVSRARVGYRLAIGVFDTNSQEPETAC
jgi:hypothetical protein